MTPIDIFMIGLCVINVRTVLLSKIEGGICESKIHAFRTQALHKFNAIHLVEFTQRCFKNGYHRHHYGGSRRGKQFNFIRQIQVS